MTRLPRSSILFSELLTASTVYYISTINNVGYTLTALTKSYDSHIRRGRVALCTCVQAARQKQQQPPPNTHTHALTHTFQSRDSFSASDYFSFTLVLRFSFSLSVAFGIILLYNYFRIDEPMNYSYIYTEYKIILL